MESIVMIVAMLAVMYLFVIRPDSQRKKKAQEMRDSLKKGDVITSIGGVVGKIVHVGPDTVVIETSEDRVRMELTKWAVSSTGVQSSEQAEADAGKKDKKEKREKDEGPKEKARLNGASVPEDGKKD